MSAVNQHDTGMQRMRACHLPVAESSAKSCMSTSRIHARGMHPPFEQCEPLNSQVNIKIFLLQGSGASAAG